MSVNCWGLRALTYCSQPAKMIITILLSRVSEVKPLGLVQGVLLSVWICLHLRLLRLSSVSEFELQHASHRVIALITALHLSLLII